MENREGRNTGAELIVSVPHGRASVPASTRQWCAQKIVKGGGLSYFNCTANDFGEHGGSTPMGVGTTFN